MKNRFQGGGVGGFNMQQMMAQAQKMQENVRKAQEELKEKEVEATSGGGMVTVTASGDKVVKRIRIQPEAIDPEDVEMLEDLVMAAVNEALGKAEELSQSVMGQATGGMNLGGLL